MTRTRRYVQFFRRGKNPRVIVDTVGYYYGRDGIERPIYLRDRVCLFMNLRFSWERWHGSVNRSIA